MGILGQRGLFSRRGFSPIAMDRKVIRFLRLVEQHGAFLGLLEDLREKQAGEYILDRRYIEARLDLAYEGVRRILYDMHVVSDSSSAEGYEPLDRLRSVSERILKDARETPGRSSAAAGEEEDWETLALGALYRDLTRAPSYGRNAALLTEPELPVPDSLSEWAGWAHVRAAQWITDQLPRLPLVPSLDLAASESEESRVQIFPLGGAREIREQLRHCVVQETTGRTGALTLGPLRAFLQGLLDRPGPDGTGRMSLQEEFGMKAGKGNAPLRIYAGENFLLVWLPPFLPLRLFGCSLSLHPSESMIYLFGTRIGVPSEPGGPGPFSLEQEPFPVYRCNLAGRWMYWASHFSWAQGEERVRMLGDALAVGMTARGRGTAHEDARASLHGGIARFLKQTAIPERKVSR